MTCRRKIVSSTAERRSVGDSRDSHESVNNDYWTTPWTGAPMLGHYELGLITLILSIVVTPPQTIP